MPYPALGDHSGGYSGLGKGAGVRVQESGGPLLVGLPGTCSVPQQWSVPARQARRSLDVRGLLGSSPVGTPTELFRLWAAEDKQVFAVSHSRPCRSRSHSPRLPLPTGSGDVKHAVESSGRAVHESAPWPVPSGTP